MESTKGVIFDGRFLSSQHQSGIKRDSESFLRGLIDNKWPVKVLKYKGQESIRKVGWNEITYPEKPRFIDQNFKSILFGSGLEVKELNPSFFFLSQVSPIKISKNGLTVPRIIRIHDVFPITNPEWFTSKARINFIAGIRSLKKSDILIVNSEYTRDKVMEVVGNRLNSEIIERVSCQIPDLKATNKCGSCELCSNAMERPKQYLLAVGTIEPRKNYVNLLSAWQKSAIKDNGTSLVIVGRIGWNAGSILSHIHSTTGVIHFKSACDFQLDLLYENATAFVTASLDEGFDIPMKEAIFYGIPILASEIPVHRENTNGLEDITWFAPKDIDSIKEVIDTFDESLFKTNNIFSQCKFVTELSETLKRISQRVES